MSRLFALFLVILVPGFAFAHAMVLEVAVAAKLRILVSYEGDEPTEGATVELVNAAGETVSSGKTDASGFCELPRPFAGEYTIRANDGIGHRVSLPITLPESEDEIISNRKSLFVRGGLSGLGIVLIAAGTVLLRRFARRR